MVLELWGVCVCARARACSAGTGLLSMMAARAMGSAASTCGDSQQGGMVTACESYLPMVKLMKKVLRLNGMEKAVHVINKRSDELNVGVDVSSRADVLVSDALFFCTHLRSSILMTPFRIMWALFGSRDRGGEYKCMNFKTYCCLFSLAP